MMPLAQNENTILNGLLQVFDFDQSAGSQPKATLTSNSSTIYAAPWTEIAAYVIPRSVNFVPQLLPFDTQDRDRLIAQRIDWLKEAAGDEGIEWIAASETSLLAFLNLMPLATKPAIVLSDTGELRAMWDNRREEQVGLRFKATGDVQYVLFRKQANDHLARSSGIDSAIVVRKLIEALGLKRLMYQ